MSVHVRSMPLCFRPLQAGATMGLLALLVAGAAQAVDISLADDQVSGSLDTTLSYGSVWRVSGRDDVSDINTDDGNRNFDTGQVSQVFKVTSELLLNYENYGAFVRGTAAYDTQIMDQHNDYYATTGGVERPSQAFPQDNHFTQDTRDAASNAEILDAYVFGNWDVLDHPLSARAGNQVFNWGEGVFYRGGINTTNPVDAAKFHIPGSELKEVLVPLQALSFNLGLTDNLSMDAYYQWNWKETTLDAVGSYYATTDLFGPGGNAAYTIEPLLAPAIAGYQGVAAGFPGFLGNGAYGLNSYLDPATGTFKVANIGNDIAARDGGQWGAAFHYIAEELNSTEFGFYFVNYHTKEPTVAIDLSGYQGVDTTTLGGVVGQQAAYAIATLDMAGNAVAKRDYVEDVRMFGTSFNTTVGNASVSGEVSYRPNAPISISATDDLLSDVLLQGLGGSSITDSSVAASQACADLSGKQLCRAGLFENYRRVEMFNTSVSTIYNFGQVLSFDSLFGIAEVASQHLRGDSLKYTAYDGSTRKLVSTRDKAYSGANSKGNQISADSYGATVMLGGSWNNVYAGVKLSPYVAYQNDFKGNSDLTGNFSEGSKAYTLGMDASYLNSFEVGLAYTDYLGINSLYDRDIVSLTGKYAF
ncbi:MAG: DUF1302 domain-containing protein [Pseudomonas sp.]|uniref:DUF1302 domain-containing protein n=1 Tax=Pseudomonas sp. TaxID=306 RepID=UPI002732BA5C|nr:DUF1302 domain-containing protein [Pseudomonas sp.]MDP3848321.1 DUF1302 domain-containing protein [Pseudomonas sp.]